MLDPKDLEPKAVRWFLFLTTAITLTTLLILAVIESVKIVVRHL